MGGRHEENWLEVEVEYPTKNLRVSTFGVAGRVVGIVGILGIAWLLEIAGTAGIAGTPRIDRIFVRCGLYKTAKQEESHRFKSFEV